MCKNGAVESADADVMSLNTSRTGEQLSNITLVATYEPYLTLSVTMVTTSAISLEN